MPLDSATTRLDFDSVIANRELGRAQDEFYRTMTEWIVFKREEDGGRDCYKFALIYRDAIDRYIECLEGEKPTREVTHALQVAEKWRSILSTDLNNLSQFRLAYRDPAPDAANGHHPSG